jgi:hypothetical protein
LCQLLLSVLLLLLLLPVVAAQHAAAARACLHINCIICITEPAMHIYAVDKLIQ